MRCLVQLRLTGSRSLVDDDDVIGPERQRSGDISSRGGLTPDQSVELHFLSQNI